LTADLAVTEHIFDS